MVDGMDFDNKSTLEKPNYVSPIHTIFSKPFLNVSKIEVSTSQNFKL